MSIDDAHLLVRSFASLKDECGVGASEIATTYGGRGTRSRSGSGFSDSVSDVSVTPLGSGEKKKTTSDDEENEGSFQPCTPTIAPLHPSLAQLCLSEVEAEPDEDLLPVALKDLPMHRMRTTSDLFEQARHFSSHSNPHTIQTICREKIPGWSHLFSEDINVDQIMAGLSNQLFKVNIREDYLDRARFSHPYVLFRIYGKDVNSLYDSQTEIKVFKQLGKRGVAPRLIAEFEVCCYVVTFMNSCDSDQQYCRSNHLSHSTDTQQYFNQYTQVSLFSASLFSPCIFSSIFFLIDIYHLPPIFLFVSLIPGWAY